MLRLLIPATDRNLLSIEELRSAAGVTGAEQDAELRRLGLQVSDMIAAACHIPRAGVSPPTLLRETLAQTFDACSQRPLVLSRRFVELVSVQSEADTIDPDTVELDFASGMILRLGDGVSPARPLRIVYNAGFPETPTDVAYAAILAVREFWSASSRDPLLRAEASDDVGRLEYQVGASNRGGASPLPTAALALLSPYTSVAGV
ncbi:hypothetical protein ACLNGM_10060 [Aureimonas phyllosphaerae]|uniref:hypothetical protein n=1 Tax=Aureimonas phyllosphaerae TaxID=1166078 RepID=UPI003A5C16C3